MLSLTEGMTAMIAHTQASNDVPKHFLISLSKSSLHAYVQLKYFKITLSQTILSGYKCSYKILYSKGLNNRHVYLKKILVADEESNVP
jgi:hypothetical protein